MATTKTTGSGITPADLMRKRRRVTVEWDNGERVLPLEVTYNPDAYSGELEEELTELDQRTRSSAVSTAAWLSRLLIEWDLEEKPGVPFPTSRAGLSRLPFPFVDHVLGAIFRDMRPNGLSEAS